MDVNTNFSQQSRTLPKTKWYKISLTIILTLGLSLFPPPAFCQEDHVQLTVQTGKSIYQVGEPIIIRAVLTNPAEEPVRFDEMNFDTGTIQYFIKSGNGTFKESQSGFHAEPNKIPMELQSNGQSFFESTIHFDHIGKSLVFPFPGQYTIKLEYVGYISTPPLPPPAEITLNVIKNPEEELAGAAIFSKMDTADFMIGFSRDSAVIEQIKNLITTHPNSLFSLYGRYYLAVHLSKFYQDTPTDFQQAVDIMSNTDQDGFQLRSMALVYLSKWNRRLGDSDKALNYVNRVINEFPNTYPAYLAEILKVTIETTPQPIPYRLPPQEIPIVGGLLIELIEVINGYLDFFEQKNRQGVLGLLSDNFLYNDVLNKTDYADELDEDFQKLTQTGGTLEIVRNVKKSVTIEGKPTFELELSFEINGDASDPPKPVQIVLIKIQDKWYIESWKD